MDFRTYGSDFVGGLFVFVYFGKNQEGSKTIKKETDYDRIGSNQGKTFGEKL